MTTSNRFLNPENNRPGWGGLALIYLFFFYFSGVYQAFVFSAGMAGAAGLRQAVLMSVLWLIPILLFPVYTRSLTAIIGLILWASSLVSLGYFALYGQDFSHSVIFIIFETNPAESTEFLQSYFRWWMIPTLVVYSYLPYLLWKRLRPVHMVNSQRTVAVLVAIFIVSWPFSNRMLIRQTSLEVALDLQAKLMEPVAPWQLVIGYLEYKSQLAAAEKVLLQVNKLPPLENLTDDHANEPMNLVLVIGESTNRQHMGIYGYPRDTTPRLEALQDELVAFDNVYTPRPYTIEALEQALTFADEKHPDLYLKKPTLINLMKQAGYKTYWITNQQTQTKRNTMLTMFSKQADKQYYLNNNRNQNSAQYDEAVLGPFKKVLSDKSSKRKFIIIHLLGTHRKYNYRYPEKFSVFDDFKGPPWLNEEQAKEYNSYDNAVLYNDFVISSLISALKSQQQTNGLLLYFSDHGEEVYDYPQKPFAGRNEGAPTSAMYTIPFIVWGNDIWRQQHDLKSIRAYSHRPYTSSDLIFTWADLAGLSFKGFDASRSVVNQDYKKHPVWIGSPGREKNLRDLIRRPFIKNSSG